jgi:hypothetical protein
MNTQTNNKRQCWIGLAHVRPKVGNNLLEGARGAFVPILALADGIDDFVAITTTRLEAYDFEVIEIEDIEPFKDRLSKSDVEDEIKALAERLSDEDPVVMDAFQAYDDE